MMMSVPDPWQSLPEPERVEVAMAQLGGEVTHIREQRDTARAQVYNLTRNINAARDFAVKWAADTGDPEIAQFCWEMVKVIDEGLGV